MELLAQVIIPTGNPLGKIFVILFTDSGSDRMLDIRPEVDLRATAVGVLAALHAHQRKAGMLPDGLADLVPDYLPAVPVDPFSGEAFGYDRERRVIYSVGRNRVDDGGMYDDAHARSVSCFFGPDLVFLIDGSTMGQLAAEE